MKPCIPPTIISFVILLLTISVESSYSEDRKLTTMGFPVSKIESNQNQTKRYELTKNQTKEYQVVISEFEGRFYWESRNKLELIKTISGIYTNYVSPTGSGYIKVSTLDNTYLEHINSGLGTITYWGIVQE
jgi:hypothetical protein